MFFSEMLCYFYTRWMGHTPSKSSTFVSSVHRVFSQKSWGSWRCFLAKLRWAFMFFLLGSGFGLGTLPCRPFLPSLFLMVESWTLTLTEESEACSSLDVVVGFFCDLLDESSLRSWGNFGRPATPGKVHHCSMFSPFVDNGSHCGSLESQRFRNGFITFSRLIDLNYFLSHLFLAFEDLLVYFTLSGRSYLSDFLIANRCGNNQAWMWLEKLKSGVINHSYVLTGGGGGKHFFHTGPCGFGFCFPFIKKTLHLKTACCVLLVLSLINI